VTFLLDTCVLSELTRPQPDPHVVHWLGRVPEGARFVSVVTLAEIKFGILCVPPGRKRAKLEAWFEEELGPFLAERILVFDQQVALRWAALRSISRNAPVVDSQIAATALEHRLTVVTRNVGDFDFEGLSTFNPWRQPSGPDG
jgi:predicted nucleic acid-binding protein